MNCVKLLVLSVCAVAMVACESGKPVVVDAVVVPSSVPEAAASALAPVAVDAATSAAPSAAASASAAPVTSTTVVDAGAKK